MELYRCNIDGDMLRAYRIVASKSWLNDLFILVDDYDAVYVSESAMKYIPEFVDDTFYIYEFGLKFFAFLPGKRAKRRSFRKARLEWKVNALANVYARLFQLYHIRDGRKVFARRKQMKDTLLKAEKRIVTEYPAPREGRVKTMVMRTKRPPEEIITTNSGAVYHNVGAGYCPNCQHPKPTLKRIKEELEHDAFRCKMCLAVIDVMPSGVVEIAVALPIKIYLESDS